MSASQPVWYIKVSKIDQNGVDQTNTLQSLTQITLPWVSGSVTSNETFQINSLTQFQDHFLYEIDANINSTNPNNLLSPTTIENNRSKIEYEFSSSIQNQSIPSTSEIFTLNPITDNLNYYTSSPIPIGNRTANAYQLLTYPQKDLYIECSGSINNTSFNTVGDWELSLRLNRANSFTFIELDSTIIDPEVEQNLFFLTSSITESLPGDKYFLFANAIGTLGNIGNVVFSSDSYFSISSSAATGPEMVSIPEPYMSANYANALNCQPLYGNATENQTSYKYQLIDYSTGITIPTNFDLIIDGNALKAQVQDSNYTSLRHISSRYLGSKNTTEDINKWTDTNYNEGNFGKTPSIESLKTQIAYAEWVSGWPPEKQDASTVKIKYLIDEDGNLTSPGASENFIQNLRNNFQVGEEIKLIPSRELEISGEFTRKVIRSGKRIEPYLYNQIEYPERDGISSFTSSLDFVEFITSGVEVTENLTAAINIDGDLLGTGIGGNYMNPNKLNNISTGTDITTEVNSALVEYEIQTSLLSSNIESLTFDHNATITNNNNFISSFYARLVRIRAGVTTELKLRPVGSLYGTYGSGFIGGAPLPLQLRHTIPTNQLQVGDKIRIQYTRGHSNVFPLNANSTFTITQSPSPTPALTVSGSTLSENLFQYTFLPDTISIANINILGGFTPNPQGDLFLSTFYNNPNVKQKDIPTSGYNNINLPIEFKIGDEIRFEGDKTFMIEKAEFLQFGSWSFLSIRLDSPISGSGIDLNKFSITRYVDDPTSIIVEGFRPPNSTFESGPYLVEPDYKTKKLDDNVDKYINEYTNKGLL